MNTSKNIKTVLADHLFDNYISKLSDTQKLIVNEIDFNFSKELAYIVNNAHSSKLPSNCNVVVLSKEVRNESFEVSPQKAVEYRNQKAPMLIFVPTEFNELSSLQGLKTLHTVDLINSLISEYAENTQKLGLPFLTAPLRKGIINLSSPDVLLSFLIDVSGSRNPLEYFARNLARIGLIPDEPSNILNNGELERNLQYAIKLNRRAFPLVDTNELVSKLGLPDGEVKSKLRDALEKEEEFGQSWLEHFNSELDTPLFFINWPLGSSLSTNIVDLRFKSFLSPDGGVNKKCKLGLHLKSHEYVCTGKIVLDWLVDPVRLPSEISFKVEILNSVNMDVAETMTEVILKSSAKSRAFDLSEFLDDTQQRFVARISLIDEAGNYLTKEDGELAQALSEDFLLIREMETDIDSGDSKSTNIKSVPEGLIISLLNDKSVDSIPSEMPCKDHPSSQTFEVEIGNRLARMRVSSFIRMAQEVAMKSSEKSLYFRQAISLGASVVDARSLVALDIELSAEFLKSRKIYLDYLSRNGQFHHPETLIWNEEIDSILDDYISSYILELENSDSGTNRALLALDTVTVTIETANGEVEGTILLPIHPLRSKWLREHYRYLRSVAEHLLEVPFSSRRNSIDLNLLSKLEPTNLPFAVEVDDLPRIYASEFLYGAAIYLAPDVEDVANQVSIISSAIGITRDLITEDAASKKIAEHLTRYREANNSIPGLRLSVVNPGDGTLFADGLLRYEKARQSKELVGDRFEISCYASSYSYVDPIGALVDLQKTKFATSNTKEVLFNSHFALKALTFEDFDRNPEYSNISVMQSATQLKTEDSCLDFPARQTLVDGLITYLHSDTLENEEGIVFKTSVSVGDINSTNLIEKAHSRLLALLSRSKSQFQMSIVMNRNMADLVNEIHRRSDWVLTIDRFIGLNLYEEMLSKNNPNIVVLDYSPDFVDGFGERITLTTTKNNEVSRIISRAMRDLGLADEGMSSLDVLRDLAKISGRLAMRLVNQNSLATEAVGLCATVKHLRDNEKLVNTIVIPVDAHPELFGLNKYDPDATSKRCDLMLVRIEEDEYSVQFIEVKTRKAADIEDLIPVMRNQLENTEELLNKVIFNSEDGRVDCQLQWARWGSLLHFYLDRSKLHGNFKNHHDVVRMHSQIQNIINEKVAPSISKVGYIVSLNAEMQNIYDENEAYQLHVLNEEMLASSGWTTLKESEFRIVDSVGDATESNVNQESFEVSVTVSAEDSSGVARTEENVFRMEEKDVRIDNNAQVKSLDNLLIDLGESATTSNFNWKISLQGSPHGVVVGIPGQGKSVTTRNILNQFAEYGLPSVVFDFHGEMSDRVSYDANTVNVADDGLPFSPFEFDSGAALPIKSAAQEIAEILASIGNLGEIQRSNVNLAIRDCYSSLGWGDDGKIGSRLPNISDFEVSLRAVEAQNKGKNAIARLQSFTDFGLFRDANQTKFEVLNPKGFIFNVSKYRQDEVKITAGAFILRKIYNEMFQWGNARHPKLAIVLDEAHRLAKDPTIPKLMKEGRKYGIVVLLVSQSLEDFAPQVIENAGTKIAFRTNYPASRKVASLLQNKNSKELADRLEVLITGKAIVSTPENPKPALVKMRNDH